MRLQTCGSALAAVLLGVNLPYAQADTQGTVLAAPGGRYVFGQISGGRIDQYMLDTQTGQLWQLRCVDSKPNSDSLQCATTALDPVLYIQLAGAPSPLGVAPWYPPASPAKK